MLRGLENLSFARFFKHCGLKTSDFKPLKGNQKRKITYFVICARLRDGAQSAGVLNSFFLRFIGLEQLNTQICIEHLSKCPSLQVSL